MVGQVIENLDAEKVAYWYLRLNGFFQMENFIVHPKTRDSQRTDADLIGVRFPYRAEHRYDNPERVMQDDVDCLGLSQDTVEVVIVEVKAKQRCSLNGPWSNSDRQNVQRVLVAIGCLSGEEIEAAAKAIYETGLYEMTDSGIRVRLVAIGLEISEELAESHSSVVQVTWPQIFGFIGARLHEYRSQKRDVKQWDSQIKLLQTLVKESRGDPAQFVETALERLSARVD